MSNTTNTSSSAFSIVAIVGSFLLGCTVATTTIWLNRKASKAISKVNTKEDDSVKVSEQIPTEQLVKEQRDRTITTLPPDIRNEQLSRHQLYFGDDGMQALRNARVCVIGLGGVGSHTAHMLARSGIGMMRLIDFDQVTVSSLNRHAVASLHDVGIPKVTCLANYIRKHICPDPRHLRIETFVEMYTEESGDRLLRLDCDEIGNSCFGDPYGWTMLIDCIDDIPTKAALIRQCWDRKIRVVSCMGAGGKADFTRLHWSDLRTASKDPLATKLRQTLKFLNEKSADSNGTSTARSRNGRSDNDYLDDMDRLSVLYSSEKTVVKLADFTDEQKKSSGEIGYYQYGAVDGMRIRVVPVLGTMPAIFGQALATICLTVTGKKEIQPVTGERIGRNVRNRIYQHLKSREQRIANRVLELAQKKGTSLTNIHPDHVGGFVVDGIYISKSLRIDQEDVEYLMELWRNRCAVTGDRLGTVLELIRWDISKPTICSNLVLVSSSVGSRFDIGNIELTKSCMDVEVRHRIETRLESCRIDVNG